MLSKTPSPLPPEPSGGLRRIGLPVLGSISKVERPGDRRMRFVDLFTWIGALLGVMLLYAVLMIVESQVGLGKVVQAAGDARSIGDLINVLARALSQAFAPLFQ